VIDSYWRRSENSILEFFGAKRSEIDPRWQRGEDKEDVPKKKKKKEIVLDRLSFIFLPSKFNGTMKNRKNNINILLR
jgi:hypothetical protein